eukprot:457808_1
MARTILTSADVENGVWSEGFKEWVDEKYEEAGFICGAEILENGCSYQSKYKQNVESHVAKAPHTCHILTARDFSKYNDWLFGRNEGWLEQEWYLLLPTHLCDGCIRLQRNWVWRINQKTQDSHNMFKMIKAKVGINYTVFETQGQHGKLYKTGISDEACKEIMDELERYKGKVGRNHWSPAYTMPDTPFIYHMIDI